MQGLIGNELGVDLSALGSCVCLEQGNYVFLAKTSWSNSVCLKLNSLPCPLNLHLCLLCRERPYLCYCPRWKFDFPDPSFFITDHVCSVTKSYLFHHVLLAFVSTSLSSLLGLSCHHLMHYNHAPGIIPGVGDSVIGKFPWSL